MLWLVRTARARARLAVGVEPLSFAWGGDRGEAIFTSYLCDFLQEFRDDIRGHCLEFYDDSYTTGYGKSTVTKLDIIHVDGTNPRATIVADLTKPNDVPSDCFDCIICTHTLHLIFEVRAAVTDLHRILKPGGVLLVAVPQVSMCDPGWHEFWRFTPEGLHRLLATVFKPNDVQIRAYGNSLTAAGQLRGLTSKEFTAREFTQHDPRFAVEVCARAVKQASESIEPKTDSMEPR
jgi:SAM-dependent methyltransferase